MCTTCNKTKQKAETPQSKIQNLDWIGNLQRIYYAKKKANAPTADQEIIAQKRLETCETCENLQKSEVINIANDFLLSDEIAQKLEPHLNKQCGLCGCSCVLLAYDQLESSKPCKIDKF